jgi:hypothetical protein
MEVPSMRAMMLRSEWERAMVIMRLLDERSWRFNIGGLNC